MPTFLFVPGTIEASTQIRVYMSSNMGLTWVEADAGNRITDYDSLPACYYVESTHIIVFGYRSTAGYHRVVEFDCEAASEGSGGWGTPSIDTTGPTSINGSPSIVKRISDGAVFLFYGKIISLFTDRRINYAKYSGGVWSNVDTQINTGLTPNDLAGVLDANEDTATNGLNVYFNNRQAGVNTHYIRTLLPDGSMSAFASHDDDAFEQGYGRMMIWGGKIWIAQERHGTHLKIIHSDAASSPTTLTRVSLVGPAEDPDIGTFNDRSQLMVSSNGARLYAFYYHQVVVGGGGDGNHMVYSLYTTDGVNWSTPMLFYDTGHNDPNAVVPTQGDLVLLWGIQQVRGIFLPLMSQFIWALGDEYSPWFVYGMAGTPSEVKIDPSVSLESSYWVRLAPYIVGHGCPNYVDSAAACNFVF